jgi:phosphoenolpyruvate synthase/pyruvate phosphate dikinase
LRFVSDNPLDSTYFNLSNGTLGTVGASHEANIEAEYEAKNADAYSRLMEIRSDLEIPQAPKQGEPSFQGEISEKANIYDKDPFVSIDIEGVGELIKIGVERGRATRKNLKIGICGEHAGDPASIDFCHRAGLDYVSCSPPRVPIARLAAAQAKLRNS